MEGVVTKLAFDLLQTTNHRLGVLPVILGRRCLTNPLLYLNDNVFLEFRYRTGDSKGALELKIDCVIG